MPDLEKILTSTLTAVPVEQSGVRAKEWLRAAKHPYGATFRLTLSAGATADTA